jgi:hypothetical protein
MRPGRDADHLTPSSAEVVNDYELYSSPPKRLHGVQRDCFTLLSIWFKANGNYTSPVIVSGNNGSELVSRSFIIQYFILQSRYIMLMLMCVLMNCILDM